MTRWVIISAFGFLIGNILWPFVDEEKVYFVPLAVLLLVLFLYVRKTVALNESTTVRIFIDYFVVLAAGNVLKELLFNPTVKELNDYWFGGLVTLVLIITLWVNRKKK